MPKNAQHFNAEGTHVYLVHPDLAEGWWAPAGVAQAYVDGRGWTYAEPVDDSFSRLFDSSTAEGAEQTGFDPAGQTVAEVNDHLAAMHEAGADGEVNRVLALEVAGQNRKGVKDPRPSLDDPNGTGSPDSTDSTDPNATTDGTTNG